MLKLSKKVDYGLVLLSELHKAGDGVQWSQPPQGC